jgi:predicted nucleic acid-binding protein
MTDHDEGLLDTSTLILLDRIESPTSLPRRPRISAVTLAELSVGPLVAPEAKRARRQAHVQNAETEFDPIPFDADAARAFGGIAAAMRRRGPKTSARAFDAMIAAVAIANGLPLYTCNPRDFRDIDGLEVVEVELASA